MLVLCSSCKEQASSTIVLEYKILSHPRLFFPQEGEEKLKEQIKTIPLAGNLYKKLLEEADSLLSVPLQAYTLQDGYIPNMLGQSRNQIYRNLTLALAYRMTNDPRYLKKAEEELINVCHFPQWNPRHYLDVAEMTTAVAIGYDWLYADLEETTKQLIVDAIKTKALDLAIEEYKIARSGSWAKRETNWNVVCNTGMVIGAMAIAEDYPEQAGEIIQNAIQNVPNCLKHYAPDGICYEGPAYWGYTNIYLSLLLSVLNDNFNQDFGLSGLEGVDKAARYYVESTSPSGKIFNFANSGSTSPDTNPIYFFFSKHFNQPEVAAFYRDILSKQLEKPQAGNWFFFMSLPWFDNTPFEREKNHSKLQVFKGINDIGVLRGDQDTAHFIYLIAKGGDPDEAHQQMDVGTFIVETDGVRWSDDPGADSYDLPGFWDYSPHGQRWHYFRNTNFGHNTLAIDEKIQYSAGAGKIITYNDQIPQPYFTIDMTTAYDGQASSVLRTFTLEDYRSVSITDKVSLISSSQEITWNMVTAAQISNKGKEAVLTKDGKSFSLKIISPENAVFTSKQATRFTEKEYLSVNGSVSTHLLL